MKLLRASLLVVPLPLLLNRWNADPLWVFALSLIALVPLAGWVSVATEDLARRLGALGGSLLNAAFSNAAELIVALVALRSGLVGLVKASIAGAIAANMLLVIGAGFFVGGCFHRVQRFHRGLARQHAGMLSLAVTALLVPTVFHYTEPGLRGDEIHRVSWAVGCVLLGLYGLYLLYNLRGSARHPGGEALRNPPRRSATASLVTLAGAVAATAWLSSVLVDQVEPVVARLGVSQLALGFVVIPLAGNVAEYVTAIAMAAKNRMNIAVGVATSASLQVALLLAPLLIVLSPLVGGARMSLVFTLLEVTALVAAVAVANIVVTDGKSNWFEGAQLVGAYVILAVAMWFV